MKRGISHLEISAASFSEDRHRPAIMVDFHLLSHSEVPGILMIFEFKPLENSIYSWDDQRWNVI